MGLKPNYKKSIIYTVGRTTDVSEYPALAASSKFKWLARPIQSLGVIISMKDTEEMQDINYSTILEKANAIVKAWGVRDLTLQGKIQVVNSLCASLFVYKMQVLPSIDSEMSAMITRMISRFIWNGKKPKIKMEILQADKAKGGRQLINVRARDQSLKVQWIQRLTSVGTDPVLIKLVYYHLNTEIKNSLFWECNLHEKDTPYFAIQNQFWKDVLHAWCKVNFSNPETGEQMAGQCLWYNSNVRIANSIVFYPELYQAGLLYVKDLYYQGAIMSCSQINELYNVQLSQMRYNALVSAVPCAWKKEIMNSDVDIHAAMEEPGILIKLCESTKWSKTIYYMLIDSPLGLNHVKESLLKLTGQCYDLEQIMEICKSLDQTTDIAKYRSFQYRMLHNAVLMNNRLFYMGVVNHRMCDNCNAEKETVSHFFYDCIVAQRIWFQIRDYLQTKYSIVVEFTKSEVITGVITDQPMIVNLICFITKQKMYTCKCLGKKLGIKNITTEFELIQNLEHQKAMRNNSFKKYNSR